MSLKCGIVGLPNVGKSTLFNALTQTAAAEAANYPFCTIEPNVGRVSVPDERLQEIATIAGSENIIPVQIEFVDIAGLVKGASKGDGLGNKFLGHIREVDAIIHVVRCFEDTDIIHVEGGVDPIRDIDIIELELIISDLESLKGRLPSIEKKAKTSKEMQIELQIIMEVIAILEQGRPARSMINDSNAAHIKNMHLITSKPILYAMNVAESDVIAGNKFSELVSSYASSNNAESVLISAKIEADIAALDEIERQPYLEAIGLKESGLARLISGAYRLLGLITYFTAGPKEARAWTIHAGFTAPKAAGVIHSDFEKGFIRAETIAFDEYQKYAGESGARDAGKLRLEGKDYIVQDGDVMHFRFNN